MNTPNPYSYRIKEISFESRTLLNFWDNAYEVMFRGEVEVISMSEDYTKNLVKMMNKAYNHGLEDKA